MARSDLAGDLGARFSPSLAEMEALVVDAFAHLPEEFRRLCGDILIRVEDFPDEETTEDLALESEFDLLGLFEGRPVGDLLMPQTGEQANRVTLYRRPILDYWAENEETLGEIVTHVLVHEIGHHFGLSDADMERIEMEA
jgi:predicted Zn-dependent protease with MMP-like domain